MPAWSRSVSRAASAVLVAALAGALYLALFALVQAAIGPATAWIGALLAATVLGAVLGLLAPARRRIERLLEAALSVRYVRARERIHRAIRELARMRDEPGVEAVIRDALREGLDVTGVRLVAGSPEETQQAIAASPAEAVVLPFPERPELHGALILERRAYSRDDHLLLETLAAQAALAIGNARAWEEIAMLERRAREENAYLREAILPAADSGALVGQSLGLRSVLAQVRQVAPTDAAVLVLGETGTGKELVVREIHRQSRRSDRVLVQVASAAVPETLLESELFGHEKGAFTGASTRRLGRFELADGGTLFLDDVDTLPLGIQAKLLRAIQEGEVQRLGGTQVRVVDVRLVAASNRDLLAEVRAGRFREDLYYRLHVVPIRLPPLRERREDIPLLVEHFARRESARLGRPIRALPAETLAVLQRYDWPGNVRELRNLVERASVMSPDGVLRLPDVLAAGPAVPDREPSRSDLGKASLAELMQRYKARLIRTAMERSGGNQRRAAELLGIHRPSLTRMLRDLGR
jgi:transcriptional regulator with GAF, ATPase, and Fis domain